ncbi:4a-hydroxytetrahydrobiopterin dehydratase [Moraxella nasovis]|uniref:4a-hydroxytetrahydrobiopterin dehydratase n=1 Tax=Moraxella nasovis TaxID=2904121 RepID=UPI001F6054F6|nr:4a-hydroxytetrahydrobiopterin dehydratase [Moraxella nasovis]UNU72934.1 4a-hydroxytetrahydrobiopterin dehydratase [Moraxella nasovis]
MSSLTSGQIALQLESLTGWQIIDKRLVRVFEFDTFADAIAFITRAAFVCVELEHYPIWENHYNQLIVKIGDPSRDDVHGRDVQLAKRIQALFES